MERESSHGRRSKFPGSVIPLPLEIETPAKLFITDALQISAQATQAITQAMQCRSFLLERSVEAKAHFPEFRDPECLVVIGLEGKLTDQQRVALPLENENRRALRIVGFDWLEGRADRILHNIISTNIAITAVSQLPCTGVEIAAWLFHQEKATF